MDKFLTFHDVYIWYVEFSPLPVADQVKAVLEIVWDVWTHRERIYRVTDQLNSCKHTMVMFQTEADE